MVLVLGRDGVVNTQPMVEGVWPETSIEIGTEEHGTDGIGNCLVTPFDRTILVRCVSTSWSNIIPMPSKQGNDLRVVVELTTLIKVDVFSRAPWGMLLKKMVKPMDRGAFGDTSVTMLGSSEVICNKDPTGLTVETHVVTGAFCILRLHARKRKINRKALIGLGSSASGVRASWFLGLLSTNTSGAFIQNGIHMLKPGDPLYMPVSIV